MSNEKPTSSPPTEQTTLPKSTPSQGDVLAVSSKSFNNNIIKQRLSNRVWRLLDYLSINIYCLIVYGGTVVVDYLLFSLIWFLMAEDIKSYEVVTIAVKFAQISIALLAVFAALVHGVLSTWSQIQLDRKLLREDEVYS